MEEASSISKAIEKGWVRAGKPDEFSVKIFEDAEKNFFGFTVKPAKVAIIIPNQSFLKSSRQAHATRDLDSVAPHQRPVSRYPQASDVSGSKRGPSTSQDLTEQKRSSLRPTSSQSGWTEELNAAAQEWLVGCLRQMGVENFDVSKNSSHNQLELKISVQLSDSSEQERTILKSLAHLAMESLKNRFKQSLKSLRITISSARNS